MIKDVLHKKKSVTKWIKLVGKEGMYINGFQERE